MKIKKGLKMNTKKIEFAEEVEPLLRTGGEFTYNKEYDSFEYQIADEYQEYESIEIAIDELVDFLVIDEKTETYLRKKYQ